MKILITGGTGLIGSAFIRQYYQQHQFTVLTRFPHQHTFANDVAHSMTLINSLNTLNDVNGFDAVINLQGEPIVGKRWNQAQKQLLISSRVKITQQLVQLINQSTKPPSVFISGSAIGFYGRQAANKINQAAITESFDQPYPEFSHQLCQQWENTALQASSNTRVCLIRTGIVLSERGGALQEMLIPFKFGLGAVIASGQQMMSWIHITDMVKALDHILNTESLNGAINLTAPNPVSNRVFSDVLAHTLHRPRFMVMPEFAARLLFGEMADLVIYGQCVVPEKLLASGFNFAYSELTPALKSLVN
ncbi:TIGR01777 family oxidoreductase [Colwellia sp. MEBiC06753]